jgi:hypothetical protein
MLLRKFHAMSLIQVLDEFHTIHLLGLSARCRVTRTLFVRISFLQYVLGHIFGMTFSCIGFRALMSWDLVVVETKRIYARNSIAVVVASVG